MHVADTEEKPVETGKEQQARIKLRINRLTNLTIHHERIKKDISDNIDRLLSNPNLPAKTVLDISTSQQKLSECVMFLESLGRQVFRSDWENRLEIIKANQ